MRTRMPRSSRPRRVIRDGHMPTPEEAQQTARLGWSGNRKCARGRRQRPSEIRRRQKGEEECGFGRQVPIPNMPRSKTCEFGRFSATLSISLTRICGERTVLRHCDYG
jgi:hypothetical protein